VIAMSSRFAAAVTANHDIATYVEFWKQGGTAPLLSSLTSPQSLVFLDGNIQLTKTSDQRGQCQLTLASPDGSAIPTTGTSPITPWGNEVRIYSGIAYADGTTEYCPMGIYRINQVQVTENGGAIQITVNGYDRSRNVSRNVVQFNWPDADAFVYLTQPQFASAISWPALARYMLSSSWPPVQFGVSGSDNQGIATEQQWINAENDQFDSQYIYPALPSFGEGTDLFDQSRQFAQAVGCDLWFNRYGICVWQSDPVLAFFSSTSNPTPQFYYTEGTGCQFDQLQRNLDDSTAFNRVVVYGGGTVLGGPFSSFVYNNATLADPTASPPYPGTTATVSPGVLADDDDPNSPTYIGTVDNTPTDAQYGQVISPGPYGVVANVITNNLLVNQVQVNNFAKLTIAQNIGSGENIVIQSALIDPRMEVDDVVSITRIRDGVVNVVYLVQSLTIPLSSKSAMQVTVREKRNLSVL
jgi:hypothetical protein